MATTAMSGVPMASALTGAPGAVLLYALIGAIAWPNGRPGGLLGVRGARNVWAGLWLVMAWLWLVEGGGANGITSAINAAGRGKLKASVAPGAKGITLQDVSGGGGSFSVAGINGSKAAQDLGLLKTGSGAVINGSPLIAGIDSVLVGSLEGGAGVQLGQISITDRNNNTATIDLSGASSIQDILDKVNGTGGGDVTKIFNPVKHSAKEVDAMFLTCHAGSHLTCDRSPHYQAKVGSTGEVR